MDLAECFYQLKLSDQLSSIEHRVMVYWWQILCSDLNPIERFGRHLENLACAYKLQNIIYVVMKAGEKILVGHNNPFDSTCFHDC